MLLKTALDNCQENDSTDDLQVDINIVYMIFHMLVNERANNTHQMLNRHDLFYCASCYSTSQILHFFFYKLKVHYNPRLSQSVSICIPVAFAHLHLCVTFQKLSQNCKLFHYYYIYYINLQSVIFGVVIVIGLGFHELCLYKMAGLIDKCVFWLLHQLDILPSLVLSPGP